MQHWHFQFVLLEIMHSENKSICAFEYNTVALIYIHQILLDKSNVSFFEVESDLVT